MAEITSVKGMHDCLDASPWQFLEAKVREVFATYGFAEVRTPILEKTDLFVRSVGEASAIVAKEMYRFVDQGDEDLSLRPEGTAPVVRAYVQASLQAKEPVSKLYYMGPMFRRERPQKGRLRQFHQIGAELFGSASPESDAEIITLLWDFLDLRLKVPDLLLEINSLGCPACRPSYLQTLRNFLDQNASALCADCQNRMSKNPMRVLDCKNPACKLVLQSAPVIEAAWCEACRTHFAQVKGFLKAAHVPFHENHRIVRGLDYYMRTAFEVTTTRLGAQSAVAAGGRYDGLVKDLGGPDVPGVGFAIGMERLLLLLDEVGLEIPKGRPTYFALLGKDARNAMIPVMAELRRQGMWVEWDLDDKSLKSQMRHASKLNARYVVLMGEEELKKNGVAVKDMDAGTQVEIAVQDIAKRIMGS